MSVLPASYVVQRSAQFNPERNVERDMQTGMLMHAQTNNRRILRALNGLPAIPQPGTDLQRAAGIVTEISKRIKQAPALAVKAIVAPKEGSCAEMGFVEALIPKFEGLDTSKLMPFCEGVLRQAAELAKTSTQLRLESEDPHIANAKALIGKLALLLDQKIAKDFLTSFNSAQDLKGITNLITESFKIQLEAINKRIAFLLQRETAYNVVNIADLRSTVLVREIASALITSAGNLNLAICDDVVNQIAKGFPELDELTSIMDDFKQNNTLIAIVEQQKAPASKESQAATLIVTICDLASNAAITDADAKRCLLATQLSALPKCNNNCGYSANFAHLLTQYRRDICLKDWSDMLAKSELSRTVNGEKEEILVDLDTVTLRALDTKIPVSCKGALVKVKGANLWDLASVQGACHAMGITDVKKAIEDALIVLAAGKTSLEVSPRGLIVQLSNLDQLLATRGIVGYCSCQINPLLVTWQDILETFATLKPDSQMRARVLSAMQKALYSQIPFENLSKDGTSFNPTHVSQFAGIFLSSLNDKLAFSYDTNHTYTLDGVDSPEKLGAFVASALENHALGTVPTVTREAMSRKIKEVVADGSFAKSVIQHFAQVDAKADLTKLKTLPWKASLGNNPLELADTYFETGPQVIKKLKAANAQELMQQLLAFAKTQEAENKSFTDAVNKQRFELSISHHVFTLDANPTFLKAIVDSKQAARWTSAYSRECAKVAKHTVSAEDRAHIIAWAETSLIPEGYDKESRVETGAIDKNLYLGSFYAQLLDIVMGYHDFASTAKSKPPENLKDIKSDQLYSFVLSEAVSQKAKEQMVKLCIPFASSTTGSDKLCFYPNPVDGSVAVGMVDPAGVIRPAANTKWLNDQEWTLSVTKV